MLNKIHTGERNENWSEGEVDRPYSYITGHSDNPSRTPGARMALQSFLELRQEARSLYTHIDQLFNVSCLQGKGILLRKATPFIPEQFQERYSAARYL